MELLIYYILFFVIAAALSVLTEPREMTTSADQSQNDELSDRHE